MSTEQFDIVIEDRIAQSILDKLSGIEFKALAAHDAIGFLKQSLSTLGVGILSELGQKTAALSAASKNAQDAQIGLSKAQDASNLSAARLATQQAKLAEIQERTRLVAAKADAETNKLAISQNKVAASAFSAEASNARLQQIMSKVAVSNEQVALVSAKVSTEQQRQHVIQSQLNNTNAQGAVIQQRLATAQAQTAVAQANGAAAAQRVASAQAQTQASATRAQQAQAALANTIQRGVAITTAASTAEERHQAALHNTAAAANRAQITEVQLQMARARQQKQEQSSLRNTSGFQALRTAGMTVASSYAIGVTAVEVVKLTDAYTQLQNKIVNVTYDQRNLIAVTDELFKVANNSRAQVEMTATAFSRFQLAMGPLGASQAEVLRLTESINKALVIGGATTGEASAGLLQFSQAMNKGKLDGDEFRTVMELMPVVADAIAKRLNVTRGELLKLAPQGKITATIMREALASAATEIDAKFSRMTMTTSQAFVRLGNNALEAWGKFNQTFGVTERIAASVTWLADNLDKVAIGLGVVAGLAVVKFAPAVVGAMGAATSATLTFSAALLANPLGLFAVAVTTAAFAVYAYRDALVEVGGLQVTVGDVARGSWEMVSDYAKSAFDVMRSGVESAVSFVGSVLSGIPMSAQEAFGAMGGALRDSVNSFIGTFVFFYKEARTILSYIPDAFATIYNLSLDKTALFVNGAIAMLNKVSSVVIGLANAVGNTTIEAPKIDTVNFDQYKIKLSGDLSTFADDIIAGYKSADQDFVGQLEQSIARRANFYAQQRANAGRALGAGGLATPGQVNLPASTDAGKNAKAMESQARVMQSITAELDKQIKAQFTLQPLQDIQNKMADIEIKLIQKKIDINSKEAQEFLAASRKKVEAIYENKLASEQFNKIYEQITGPANDYNATVKAAKELHQQGAITTGQYVQELVKALDTYDQSLDPMYKFNKTLREQNEIAAVSPGLRQQEIALQEQLNALRQKGIVYNKDSQKVVDLRRQISEQQLLAKNLETENKLWDNSVGVLQDYARMLGVIYQMREKNPNEFSEGAASAAVMQQMPEFDWSQTTQYADAQAASFEQMYAKIEVFRQQDVKNEETAAILRRQVNQQQQSAQLQAYSGFFGQVAQLQSAHSKSIARIGKAAAITQTLINTYEGASKALAQGGIYGGLMAGAVIAAGMVQVDNIRRQGYKQGGYTGNFGEDEVAGVVHGKEFVVNARATAENRPILEAMNAGVARGAVTKQTPVQQSQLNVSITNQIPNAQFDVVQIDEKQVEIIAKRVVSSEVDGYVAANLDNPNSRTSKALGKNTQTVRRF